MYQQVELATHVLLGAPGPVPDRLAGLTDAQLADLSAFSDPPPAGFAGMGLWPMVVRPPTSFDPSSQMAVDPNPSDYAADPATRTVVGQQTARVMTADELSGLRASLVAYAAAARYTLETAGIMVGNSTIATDRDSQALINGAYNYVLAKPDASIEFKGVTGWVTLTADQVQTIALAVGGRVQALFAAERQIDAAIQAGTITTTAQIDAALAAAGG